MSEAKFTPGPWVVAASRGGFCDVKWGEQSIGGLAFARKGYDCQFHIRGISPPDAHLIAAAPELYEALQACLDHGSMTGHDFVIEQAHSALAKARGEA